MLSLFIIDGVVLCSLELREELRLENRKAFGNIWSDILAGLTLFLLLVYNPERVKFIMLLRLDRVKF